MKIIIAGVGDVGFHLAKMLSKESHDIFIIDIDKNKLDHASSHIDVSCIEGRSISKKVLFECDIKHCDLLIACTDSEENNILTAIVAKKLGAQKTIARVKDNQNISDYDDLGIDDLISTEYLSAQEIKRLLQGSFTDSFIFDDGLFSLVGLQVAEDSIIDGSTTGETCCNCDDYRTAAILRDNQTYLPNGGFEVKSGDFIYFLTKENRIDHIQRICGKSNNKVRSIMVVGANNTSYYLIKELSKYHRVKLIDKDYSKCQEFSNKLPKVQLVIHGDVHDLDMLKEESLETFDAFISLTDNTETNIMSCLLAKNEGVKKTIALVDNMEYIHLSQNIGIDTMINKKMVSADAIYRHIRKGSLVSQATLHGVDAEVLEYSIDWDSNLVEKTIEDIDIPGRIIGMVRNREPFIPSKSTEIMAYDKIISIVRTDDVEKVEKVFN